MRTLVVATLTASAFAAAAAPAQRTPSSDSTADRVLRTVADSLAVTYAAAGRTIVALPPRCFPVEQSLCADSAHTGAARVAVAHSAELFAELRGATVSPDPMAAAAALIAPARVDSALPRSSWYRVCGAEAGGEAVERVTIIRPSAVRETVAGAEWRVVVMIASYPTRGECLGYSAAHDYIVVRDASGAGFRVAGTQLIGGGTGRGPAGTAR